MKMKKKKKLQGKCRMDAKYSPNQVTIKISFKKIEINSIYQGTHTQNSIPVRKR
jgi:hypothetical protein